MEVTTLPYRAPEVLLGGSEFTFAIDAWALGCLGVEIIQGQRLFPTTNQVDLLFKICTTFGSPKPGGVLSQLPFARILPKITRPAWPPDSLRPQHPLLVEMLT